MKVLGLDLSLRATGVVLVAGDELDPEAGVELLRSETLKSGDRQGVNRLIWISERIRDIAAPADSSTGVRTPADLAAIEGYSYDRGNQAHQLGELGGVVRLMLHRLELPFVAIPNGTWKKQLLGNGSTPKHLVPRELFKRYAVDADSVDELEAYAVALAAFRSSCGLDQPEPKRRRAKR